MQTGDLLPHVDGVSADGRPQPYGALWQRRNVVLFVLPGDRDPAAQPWLADLDRRLSRLQPDDTRLVISDDPVAGLPTRALAVADRWGEIACIRELPPRVASWPGAAEILEWVEFIRAKCPECPP